MNSDKNFNLTKKEILWYEEKANLKIKNYEVQDNQIKHNNFNY